MGAMIHGLVQCDFFEESVKDMVVNDFYFGAKVKISNIKAAEKGTRRIGITV